MQIEKPRYVNFEFLFCFFYKRSRVAVALISERKVSAKAGRALAGSSGLLTECSVSRTADVVAAFRRPGPALVIPTTRRPSRRRNLRRRGRAVVGSYDGSARPS